MKKLKIGIVAILLFVALAVIGSAVPLVPQNMGLRDSSFADIDDSSCKAGCHADIPDTHHAMIGSGSTPLGCMSCHPWDPVAQAMVHEQNCKACHKVDTAWTGNSVVNLTKLRGDKGRPHHNITKNSTWNLGSQAAYWAADRQCNNCHDTGLVDSYNDNHYVPSYAPSLVTPMSTFKINATVGGGQEWGGCYACHDEDATATPVIGNPDDTHHGIRYYLGYQCNNCHVSKNPRAEPVPDYNPEPSASYYKIDLYQAFPQYATMFQWDNKTKIEFRNSTLGVINGTGCEKCHSVKTLHTIQYNSEVTVPGEIPMMGHVGNNSDCNGCHAGWDASTDPSPFADAEKAITLNSVTPSILTAGTATDVTLTGDNFVQDPYETTVSVDGVPVTLKSATSSQIVVTIPGDLTAGGHSLRVEKGGIASSLSMLSVVDPGTITSAKLASGVLTIVGTGLGADQQGVAISKADGRDVLSDSITSSTDTQIVAVSSLAAVGDTVTVMTPKGAATAIIAAGEAPPTGPVITSAKLVSGTLTIDGSGFETKPSRNAQSYVTTVKSGKTYSAKSIKSWSAIKIVAPVDTKNWKVGQTVTVKTVSGKTVTATIT